MLAVGATVLARRWSPAKFAELADRLIAELGAEIWLVGMPGDDGETVKALMQYAPVDRIGKTTLPELTTLIRSADVFCWCR